MIFIPQCFGCGNYNEPPGRDTDEMETCSVYPEGIPEKYFHDKDDCPDIREKAAR